MKVNGLMTSNMAKESTLIKTVQFMTENGKMISSMGMELNTGLMVLIMKVTLKKDKKWVKAP